MTGAVRLHELREFEIVICLPREVDMRFQREENRVEISYFLPEVHTTCTVKITGVPCQ